MSNVSPTSPSTMTTTGDDAPQYLEWKTKQAREAMYRSDRKVVSEFAKTHLFSRVKFITTDEELKWEGIYFNCVCFCYCVS